MADSLIGTSRYSYRSDLSLVLLSPTVPEARASIIELYRHAPTEVFIYFAGHAESRDGRLFLKMKDTQEGPLLPATAYRFSDLLETVLQAPGLAQLNVVIDACNAGGIQLDLARLLGERTQEAVGRLNLSVLAGSAHNLSARETAAGGRLTTSIVSILDGTETVQRWSPYLDLSQIAASVEQQPTVSLQRPSYWGMNLSGANPIAPNPKFDPSIAASATSSPGFYGGVSLSPEQREQIRRFIHALRDDGWSPDILRPVEHSLSSRTENERVSVYLGIAEAVEFYEFNKRGFPPAREAMLLQALLPMSGDPSVMAILRVHADKFVARTQERLSILLDDMSRDPRSLMVRAAGFGHLYTLPIQLSLVLGWVGLVLLHGRVADGGQSLRQLVGLVLKHYGNSVVAVDDREASGILLFVLAARLFGWTDEYEEVLSRLFADLHRSRGRVARNGMGASERITYLLQRYDPASSVDGLIQRPSELMGVVLVTGALVGLDHLWDSLLFDLDHVAMNLFLADQPTSFADEKIGDGENVTLEVGHQFATLADLRRLVADLALSDAMNAWPCAAALDAIALCIPNRVSWSRLMHLLSSGALLPHVPSLRISSEDPETHVQTLIYEQVGRP